VIIELAIDAERNLSKPYEFDAILLRQVMPLVQRYHMRHDNALSQITDEFNKISKFRLTVSIGERHKEITQIFLQYGISKLPLEAKISRAKNILEKITLEGSDSVALEFYDLLKLCFDDENSARIWQQLHKPRAVRADDLQIRYWMRFQNSDL
jgi:hypothetical protein